MKSAQPWRLAQALTQLVIVDVQTKLLPFIADYESVVAQCERMIRAAAILELPVTMTEQYPQGLGATHTAITAAAADAGAPLLQKMSFGVCSDEACRRRLEQLGRPQVLLIGIEAHVCVQQTALELLELGLRPTLIADAVGSRRPADKQIALERLRAAGADITTFEAAVFELLRLSGTERFKRILPLVK